MVGWYPKENRQFANLAAAFAVKGYKVVQIGCDQREPTRLSIASQQSLIRIMNAARDNDDRNRLSTRWSKLVGELNVYRDWYLTPDRITRVSIIDFQPHRPI